MSDALGKFEDVDWTDLKEIAAYVADARRLDVWSPELCEQVTKMALAYHPLDAVTEVIDKEGT